MGPEGLAAAVGASLVEVLACKVEAAAHWQGWRLASPEIPIQREPWKKSPWVGQGEEAGSDSACRSAGLATFAAAVVAIEVAAAVVAGAEEGIVLGAAAEVVVAGLVDIVETGCSLHHTAGMGCSFLRRGRDHWVAADVGICRRAAYHLGDIGLVEGDVRGIENTVVGVAREDPAF